MQPLGRVRVRLRVPRAVPAAQPAQQRAGAQGGLARGLADLCEEGARVDDRLVDAEAVAVGGHEARRGRVGDAAQGGAVNGGTTGK